MRFLITAGPTREFIDPVRFISNRSSGKMGYALAEAARAISPHVTLVSGPVALKPPKGVNVVLVTTTAELAAALAQRFDRCDVLIMAAAVCDFRPRHTARSKIKKSAAGGTLTLELVENLDVVASLGRRKKRQVVIGFAAETNDLLVHARAKLHRKQLDLIVANDASAMDAETNQVTLLYRNGHVEPLPELPKTKLARIIIERAIALVGTMTAKSSR